MMAVNIFGQPANLKKLRKIADEKNNAIEDNAQLLRQNSIIFIETMEP